MDSFSSKLARFAVNAALGLSVLALLTCAGAAPVLAQERVCPDGGRSYFGVCPGETILPGPLQTKIENLRDFPDTIAIAPPATMLESYLADKTPEKLFGIVLEENKEQIAAVPTIGAQLFAFKGAYYQFRQEQIIFENGLLPKIGNIVNSKVPDAWLYYLRYFIMRAGGNDQKSIEANGNFLNYGITWDDAERVYGELTRDPKIAEDVRNSINAYPALSRTATSILRGSGK